MQSEVHFLGRLYHPNLVKLLGYCLEDKELLLVYEFMQKGSLENHLFGSEGSTHFQFLKTLSIFKGRRKGAHGEIVLCSAQEAQQFSLCHGNYVSKLLLERLVDLHFCTSRRGKLYTEISRPPTSCLMG